VVVTASEMPFLEVPVEQVEHAPLGACDPRVVHAWIGSQVLQFTVEGGLSA
jgi:hypothetical protein